MKIQKLWQFWLEVDQELYEMKPKDSLGPCPAQAGFAKETKEDKEEKPKKYEK